MVAKIDRTGEVNYNKFGSKMEIIEYRMNRDIDVYFPEYNWITKNSAYKEFKNGSIICPYEKRYFGVGYLGEGKYKTRENGKSTKCYYTWIHMLERCYSEKYKNKYSTYEGCIVCEEWLNFQNFAKWFYENYYEIEGERIELDKDILIKGNKVYSPNTCVFVPQRINSLFIKCNKNRGAYPVGVSYHKKNNKYVASCRVVNFKLNKSKDKYLGSYNTLEEAFKVYKQFKEKYIKVVADLYKDKIPQKLYDAMYNYKVEITD